MFPVQAELTRGDGTAVPFTLHAELLTSVNGTTGYDRLIVEHPRLPPDPRPVHLRLVSLNYEGWLSFPYALVQNTLLPESGLRITIGPALAGDLNDDGDVGLPDVLLALRGTLDPAQLTETQQFAADLWPREGGNGHPIGDGRVDLGDVLRILKRAVGLVPDAQWP